MGERDYWLDVPGDKLLEDERFLLFDLAGQVYAMFKQHTAIVNIGVSKGGSAHCLFAGAPEARHVSVDIRYRLPIFQRERLGSVEFVEAESGEYGRGWKGQVHLLFVDGNHGYATVKSDIAAWKPHIAIGGVMAFHDYLPALEDLARLGHKLAGVRQAVDEWQAREANWDEVGRASSVIAFRRVW